MNKLSFENFERILDETLERVEAIEHKVKHGKYKIQRKKIKSQVLKGRTPQDLEREKICRNARKKAHTVISNTKRDISNDTRKHTTSCNEGLEVINESATTLSGRYGLDFLEEAVGWDGVNFTFFDKPETTPLSEGLDIGTTATGRKRKCKAIGIAEGVFAPIMDADGERVFSRNKRLYECDHWEYQLENMNFFNRVHTRRMLGMIGHEDKKITDEDLREGRVSHIVTDLEIREDEEHGKYLWGRLEILNTKAGRNLKEYYENDIPLFVSSRGGGKLLDVPGQNYKMVDKKRYYCECFDVVKEPGFLEAAPVYHNVCEENEESEDLIAQLSECLGIEETKLLEVIQNYVDENNVINEDKNMSKVNVNIDTKNDSAQEIIDKLLKPVTERMESKLAAITDKLAALESNLNEESEAEAPAEEAPVEAEPAKEEAPAEEIKEEETAEVKAEEAIEEKKCDCGKEDCPVCGKKEAVEESAPEVEAETEVIEEKKDDEKKEDDKKEEAPAEEKKDEKKDDEKKDCKECSEDAAEAVAEAPEAEAPAEVEAVAVEEVKAEEAEPVKEEWAHIDPKETAPARADLPKAPLPNGGGHKDLGADAWAKEDPKETAPAKSDIADGKNPAKTELEAKVEGEIHAEEKKDAAAVNAGIEGGANVTAHESAPEVEEKAEEVSEAGVAEAGEEQAPVAQDSAEFTQQVTDYKALYEALKDEYEESEKVVDSLLETVENFGKRHQEVVQEAKDMKIELDSVKEQLDVANKALNSYKLQEQFNITVEKANELLSSKNYETVVEELKAAEAQQNEEEAQAKAEAVSEALSETSMQAAPVSKRRQAYSAFSATISESKDEEKISESVEAPKRRRAYSAF